MAYNVFKRPMFKRGGSTTGTGIMSHVEPRIKAQRGYGNYSAGFPYEMSQFSIMPQSNIRPTNLNDYTNIPVKKNITYPITMDSIGGYGFIEPGPETNLETLPDWMLKAIGTEESRGVLSKRKTGIETAMPEKTLSGGATSLDQIVKENIAKKIAKKSEEQQKDEVEKPEPKYKESDIKTDIENEIDLLTETLGPSISKAEKALLIAKAAGTPGGLTAKLDVAREEGLKLARQKTKDERAIKLAAYKAAKDIEKTKIAAGKLGETERLYDFYGDLKIKKNRTPKEQAIFEVLEEKVSKVDEGEKLSGAVAAKIYDPNEIISLEERISELELKEKLSDSEKKELAKKKRRLIIQKKAESFLPGFGNFENGGRVMKQMGGSMEENNIVSTENVTQDQVEPTKTVQTLSYAELRDRLPKEITDDIVQLIAASERALQDFAYIRTQQDVNDFNAKYGVNLVLPASAT